MIQDDEKQARAAAKVLKQAELIAVTQPTLSEFAWVLRRVYGLECHDIAGAVRALLDTENLSVNRPAVDAGLSVLEAGGDFADGVIAYEGTWLGGEIFVSFDRGAIALLSAQGRSASLLS